ncbi:MAG: hypothetical protein HY319_20430 [Armatimonadetes bacterium]|nr:hypothetical protein [Armatimonadota bacterium]
MAAIPGGNIPFPDRMKLISQQVEGLDQPSSLGAHNALVDTALSGETFNREAPADVKEYANMARSVASNVPNLKLKREVLASAMAYAIAGSVPGTPGVALARVTLGALKKVRASAEDKEAMARYSLQQVQGSSSDPQAQFHAELAEQAGTRASHNHAADQTKIRLNGLATISELSGADTTPGGAAMIVPADLENPPWGW